MKFKLKRLIKVYGIDATKLALILIACKISWVKYKKWPKKDVMYVSGKKMNWMIYPIENKGIIITFKKTERIEKLPKQFVKIGINAIWVEIDKASGFAKNLGILIFIKNFEIVGAKTAMPMTQAKLI